MKYIFTLFLTLTYACCGFVPTGVCRRQPTKRLNSPRCEDVNTSNDIHRMNGISRREILSQSFYASTSGLLLPKSSMAADGGSTATSAPRIPTMRLGGGKSTLEVSRTIQGYWQLAGGHGSYREIDAIKNMESHYNAGITTLDTADIYGPSELIIGKFLKSQPKAIPCTKFCCFRYLEDISRSEVRQRIQSACERLQVDKLPLVAFFWADYSVKRYSTVALWLSELKEEVNEIIDKKDELFSR